MARPNAQRGKDLRTQFGIWMGMPVSARKEDERTQETFALKLGVNKKTLERWKKEPEVQAIAKEALQLLAGNDELDILNSMISKAKEGSVTHQRLYYEVLGKIGVGAKKGGGEVPKEISVTYRTVDQ